MAVDCILSLGDFYVLLQQGRLQTRYFTSLICDLFVLRCQLFGEGLRSNQCVFFRLLLQHRKLGLEAFYGGPMPFNNLFLRFVTLPRSSTLNIKLFLCCIETLLRRITLKNKLLLCLETLLQLSL